MTEKLSKLIAGRENPESYVNKNFLKGSRPGDYLTFRVPIKTKDGVIDVRFAIQDDCKCSAVKKFLDTATSDNLTFAKGKRNASVLGINGHFVEGFYAYHRT